MISSLLSLVHYSLPPITQFFNKLYVLTPLFTRSPVNYVYISLCNNTSSTAGTKQCQRILQHFIVTSSTSAWAPFWSISLLHKWGPQI